MTRTLFALLLLPAFALAAPVPKTGGKKIEDVFGTPADLNGVTCEMTRKDELKATVGKEAAAAADESKVRPLTTRTVEGDFELTVRVTHSPPDKADLATGNGVATVFAGIGLFAENSPKHTLTLLHKHLKQGDTWKSGLSMNSQHPRGGSGTGRGVAKLEDQPTYLRLTRKGDEFTSQTSADGKKWQGFGTHKVQGFGAVVVGPVATHNTTGEYAVTFDEYIIRPLTEDKK
jgi:hypothetical protein